MGYAVVNNIVWLGLHYLFATLANTACSVTINFVSNFLWVWRNPSVPSEFVGTDAE